ncbi:MAG: hypothetical protein R2752_14130 [Vicinamibacterales bacterium]
MLRQDWSGGPADLGGVRSHVIVGTRCASCDGAIELECEDLPAYPGYQTFNEYFCPHCRKQGHERTPGAIVSARIPLSG